VQSRVHAGQSRPSGECREAQPSCRGRVGVSPTHIPGGWVGSTASLYAKDAERRYDLADMFLSQIIAAGAGFLIAVLWFDLMFDVQVFRHRRAPEVPESVLDSIAAYYHRVTETASPMGRLVAIVMLSLLVALVVQTARGDVSAWVSVVSVAAALVGFGLGGMRVFRRAQRLGRRTDPADVRSKIARSILRDHLVCLAAMVTLLATQLVGA
jgi:hypothetical protein